MTPVAPFVGVWIEISGLSKCGKGLLVAPFVGVWIEIYWMIQKMLIRTVAPFVGVWIEIIIGYYEINCGMSLPSWECGLKSSTSKVYHFFLARRSLRGSVD